MNHINMQIIIPACRPIYTRTADN
uniref:Uncharacterized protein n=1 Tax=Anguilla anguilla TaxID=7936 RepID=A0A0E9TV23_ANGAN